MSYTIFNYLIKKASTTCSACGGSGKVQAPQPTTPQAQEQQPITPNSVSEVWAATSKGTKIPEGFSQWQGEGYKGWYSRDLGNGKTMMLSKNNIKNRRGGIIIDTPGATTPTKPTVNSRPTVSSRPVRKSRNVVKPYTQQYRRDPRYAGLDHNAIRAMSRGSYAQGSYY